MRRTRDISWKDYLAIAAAIAVAFGIHYAWRKSRSSGKNDDSALALKPSDFKPGSDGQRKVGSPRSIASEKKAGTDPAVAAADPEAYQKQFEPPQGLGSADLKETAAEGMIQSRRHRLADLWGGRPPEKGGTCQSAERVGPGPERTGLTEEGWREVMKEFHGAKKALTQWLKANSQGMSADAVALMENQVKSLRIRRPPSPDEPDLSWRGVGAWSVDDTGLPIVHLGGGFIRLMQSDIQRARFELTRLVAQSWTPCELARVGAPNPWDSLVSCLGVKTSEGERACADGTYSDAGWAISTALAAQLAAPGCTVPALAVAGRAQCVKRSTGRAVASAVASEPEGAQHE
jgi:hypothetical protein